MTGQVMTIDDFLASLDQEKPGANLSPLLQAMWYEVRGDWDRAHTITQTQDTVDAAWVHAYLHRKEGDQSNAGYWYSRAMREASNDTPENEWRLIVSELIARDNAG